MPKVSDKVYGSDKSKFWETPGLKISTETEDFKASVKGGDAIALQATAKQVSFSNDLQVAVRAFGSVENLLAEIEDSVNNYKMLQAKNAAKATGLVFETKVAAGVDAAVPKFIEKYGRTPNDDELGKIRSAVRSKLEAIAKLEAETVEV